MWSAGQELVGPESSHCTQEPFPVCWSRCRLITWGHVGAAALPPAFCSREGKEKKKKRDKEKSWWAPFLFPPPGSSSVSGMECCHVLLVRQQGLRMTAALRCLSWGLQHQLHLVMGTFGFLVFNIKVAPPETEHSP